MTRFILFPFFFIAVLILPFHAQSATDINRLPKLSLSASASVKKPADELRMKIGVVTTGVTAAEALYENNAKMEAIISALKDEGMTQEDYETGYFSITPTYTPYPIDPPADWTQMINGYEVRNTLLIHTADIGSAGKWIDLSNQAGANTVDDIRFALSDPRLYSDEAVSMAVANAVHDASIIAKEAGIKLVQILSINVDHSVNAPQPIFYLAKEAFGDNTTPLKAGDVTLTATVSLIYEISKK